MLHLLGPRNMLQIPLNAKTAFLQNCLLAPRTPREIVGQIWVVAVTHCDTLCSVNACSCIYACLVPNQIVLSFVLVNLGMSYLLFSQPHPV